MVILPPLFATSLLQQKTTVMSSKKSTRQEIQSRGSKTSTVQQESPFSWIQQSQLFATRIPPPPPPPPHHHHQQSPWRMSLGMRMPLQSGSFSYRSWQLSQQWLEAPVLFLSSSMKMQLGEFNILFLKNIIIFVRSRADHRPTEKFSRENI